MLTLYIYNRNDLGQNRLAVEASRLVATNLTGLHLAERALFESLLEHLLPYLRFFLTLINHPNKKPRYNFVRPRPLFSKTVIS